MTIQPIFDKTTPKLIDDFFECDSNELKNNYPSIRALSVPKKTFLYRQGDQCSDLFWIKSGIVKLAHLAEQGAEITSALFEKGDVIGALQSHSIIQKMEETAQALVKFIFIKSRTKILNR